MKENLIQEKSFAFAIRIVNLYKFLIKEKKEFVLSRQLLKSGTSIGANIKEGIGGQSKADFQSKLNISYKEAKRSYLLGKITLRNRFSEPGTIRKFAERCR